MYMRNKVKKIILFSYMPKTDTDYSNTIFYKIQCKNPDVKDMYIGHTTNFVQRKLAHKYSCIYDKCANYHCKVYNVIRENGGWDNWNMEIIAFHNCEDLYAARKLEQQYFEQYNATLNSVEPLPKPKTILSKNIPVKIENKQMQTYSNNVPKFSCATCEYNTDNKKDYNKHLITAKHINRTNIIKTRTKPRTSYNCKCGKIFTARNSLWYHKQKCIEPTIKYAIPTTDIPQITLDSQTVIKLLKQNHELKTILVEQYAQLQTFHKQNIEFQQRLVDAVTIMNATT